MSMGRVWWWGMACLVVGTLYGCGFLDMVAGVQTGPNGEVLTAGPGIGDKVAGLAGQLFGPWGVTAGTGIAWAFREWRHYRLIKAGKKDANRDGIEDAPATGA